MRFKWHLPGREGRDLTFHDELRAIETLIAAHPDEWAELLDGLGHTARLDDKRRQKRRRAWQLLILAGSEPYPAAA